MVGPNGSGKSTLLALLAGLLAPTGGELEVAVDRGEIGFLAHEPLVYRELTALENLELYGRLYRVPERRERIGMLLERYGLWDVRHQRVAAFSRGMAQRLALCRTLLHDPRLVLLDEPYSALDDDGAGVLDAELEALAGERTLVVATHDPARVRAARNRGAGARVTGYLGDVAALARKDLLLELRSRDTVPGAAPLRRLRARRLPLRAARRRRPTSPRPGSSGSPSSSPRSSR